MLKPLVIFLAVISIVRAQTREVEADRAFNRAQRLGGAVYSDYKGNDDRLTADYEDLVKSIKDSGLRSMEFKSDEEMNRFFEWRKEEFKKLTAEQKRDLSDYGMHLDQMVTRDVIAWKRQNLAPREFAESIGKMQGDPQLAKFSTRAANVLTTTLVGLGAFGAGTLNGIFVNGVACDSVRWFASCYLDPSNQWLKKKGNQFATRLPRQLQPGSFAEWLNKEKATALVKEGPKMQAALADMAAGMPNSLAEQGMTAGEYQSNQSRLRAGLILANKVPETFLTGDQMGGRNIAADASYLREGNIVQLIAAVENKDGVANVNVLAYIEKWKNDTTSVADRRTVDKLANRLIELNQQLTLTVNQNLKSQNDIKTEMQTVKQGLLKFAPDAKVMAQELDSVIQYHNRKLVAGRQIVGAIVARDVNKMLFPEMHEKLPGDVGQWASVLRRELGADYVGAEYKAQTQELMREMGLKLAENTDEAKRFLKANDIKIQAVPVPANTNIDADCVLRAVAGAAK